MGAKYDLYKIPNVRSTREQQPLHARIVPGGVYSEKEFLERAFHSSQTSNYNMMDAVVGTVIGELAEVLSEGHVTEPGELGHFSIFLKCTYKIMARRETHAESACFDNVHLRTSKEFKRKIRREIELERVDESRHSSQKTEFSMKQCQQLSQGFLKRNGGITRLKYSSLTGLSRSKVIDDLNIFIEKGAPCKRGAGRTVFCVWQQEQ